MPTAPPASRGRWRLREPDPELVRRMEREARVPGLVASLLVSRGHADPAEVETHLAASPMGLHDPFLLSGMEAATERLSRAIDDGETILVHGDYDVDGVTGTALLMRLFRLLGAKARWHIPNRLVDGYSFGPHSIERARETGATVVISVDNGTSAHDVIAELRANGVDTVVTDHHEAKPGPLPEAAAIVNPKLPGETYPWRELCGGAVAFKLAWGLAKARSGSGGGGKVSPELKRFLEDALAYVAIATVCDVVPLLDENRVFARAGLRALEVSENPGLAALARVAGIAGRRLSAEDVGFQIGPRINASGRLGSAQRAVDLLLAEDAAEAARLADELDGLNERRKEIERAVLEEARTQATDFPDDPVLVLAGEGWHQGVVGIVAARLVEEHHRPALVIGLPEPGVDGEVGRGSARTVDGFPLLEVLDAGAAHMLRHGGHQQAAGCEVRAGDVDALRAAINTKARELRGADAPAGPVLDVDAELAFGDMNVDLMRWLDRLEPFGPGNDAPVLLSRDLRLARPPREVGRDGGHLLLHLRRGDHVLKAMAFRLGPRAGELGMGAPLDAVYTPRWNTFRGETNLELVLHDFTTRSRS